MRSANGSEPSTPSSASSLEESVALVLTPITCGFFLSLLTTVRRFLDDVINGVHRVTGPITGGEAKKVACWMESRDGGGWTLAMKHYYGNNHGSSRNNGNGRRAYSNIEGDMMGHLGKWYKLDDKDIRLYLGQKNPDNDVNGGPKSSMSFMRDQNGRNTHYAPANREYTIMKKYTGRWYFAHGHVISESEGTKAELSSWALPKDYDGSFTDLGDGFLNWRGEPKCGGWGTAGIGCYGERSGGATRGGHGCKLNLCHNGWAGAMHWYMMDGYDTYTLSEQNPIEASLIKCISACNNSLDGRLLYASLWKPPARTGSSLRILSGATAKRSEMMS